MELNQIPHFPVDAESARKIRNQTKLHKWLLLGLILTSIVILAVIIHTVRIEIENRSTCGTPECMQVAAQILEHVDKDEDPCEDFYRFACGKVANVTSSKDHPKKLLKNKISQQLYEMLEEPIDEADSPIFNYEKEFYSACIADKKSTQSLNTLKKFFIDIGGWPLADGWWNPERFDWAEWAPKFRKYGLRNDQILGFYISTDSTDPTKQIVQIYPPPDVSIPKGVRDIAILFGAVDDGTLDQEIGDLMDFMGKIQEIRKKHINYTYDPPSRAPANEFQEKHKELDWLRYINSLTEPEQNTIRPDDYLEFMYTDCTKTALEFVRASRKRTVANYMFWLVVSDLYSIVTVETLDVYNTGRTRIDVCREVVKLNFSPWSSFVAYEKKFLTNQSREQATVIFNHVKREFKRLFNMNKWMTEGDKQKFRYKFNTMTEIVGLGNLSIHHSTYHEVFKDILMFKDGFLKMYLNLKKTMSMLSHNATYQQEWSDNWRHFRFLLDIDTLYFGRQNTIMLPIGALQDWYYDQHRPMYVNFATIGKSIAVTFAKVLASIDVANEDKIRWSEETLKNYEEETSCIQEKEIQSYMAEYYDFKILELGQIVGLKVAYNAYKRWVEENEEELPAKGTGYSADQLFWISALTGSCFKDTNYDFNFFVHNEPIQRNPNFASDFSCSTTAKMNPPKKCSLL